MNELCPICGYPYRRHERYVNDQRSWYDLGNELQRVYMICPSWDEEVEEDD